MRYNEFITELFDTNVSWKMLQDDDDKNFVFSTTIGDDYIVLKYNYLKEDRSEVMVSFVVNGEYNITGGGNSMRIFGAVVNNMKQFFEKQNPEIVYFTAIKFIEDTDGNVVDNYISRTNLYKKMIIKFANSIGYAYNFKENQYFDKFILTKKDKNNE